MTLVSFEVYSIEITGAPPDASKVEEYVEPGAGLSFGEAPHPGMGCLYDLLHILKETM